MLLKKPKEDWFYTISKSFFFVYNSLIEFVEMYYKCCLLQLYIQTKCTEIHAQNIFKRTLLSKDLKNDISI